LQHVDQLRPHPEERAKARVSKDEVATVSFETPAALAPQDGLIYTNLQNH
jgi:hypothetical protein